MFLSKLPALFVLILLAACSASDQIVPSSEIQTIPEVDAFVEQHMATHKIPGLALALIQSGTVIHEGYYGKADLSHNVAVQAATIFRVFSCTKLMTATAVFQLIEQGKLALTDELQQFFPDLPENWQAIRLEHLLSHASGLPDLVHIPEGLEEDGLFPALFQEETQFSPGEHFRYNQTNYWLLQRIIEIRSGESFEAFVLGRQFPGNEAGAVFSSNSKEIIPNRAHRYDYNAEQELEFLSVNHPRWAHSGNGLNLSLPAFIGWSQRFDAGELISEDTKQLMWSEFPFQDEYSQFLRGWGSYEVADQNSIGFTGGGVTAFRKFPAHDLTVVLLTNGRKYHPTHNDIVDEVAGIVDERLADPEATAANQVANQFLAAGATSSTMVAYKRLKSDYPELSFEDRMNRIGYTLMRAGQIDKAVEIFELNAEEHPDAWNVYDSLAEGYATQGKIALAVEYYEKSVEINPENQNGIEQLASLHPQLK